jgi:cytoskeletal protein RodZ
MADIGSTLRETRMRERIDITTVESATKIRAKYLRALENEEWDLLPGPTFVRTFLRTYGDYLGLDSKMLVEEYKQRFERPGPQDMLPFSSRPGRRQKPARVVPPWAVVGLIVVLLLGALFALGTFGDDSSPEEAEVTATPTATPAAQKKRDKPRKRRERTPVAPKVVKLKIVPEAAVNVCLVSGAGEALIHSETLETATDVFEAKTMKVVFGNGLATMQVNGKSFDVPDSDTAVGFELRPGSEPRQLTDDELILPACA